MNLWGALPVALLLLAAGALFWLIDRRLFSSAVRVGLLAAAQLIFVGGYVWALQHTDSLLLHLLWLLAMTTATAGLTLRRRVMSTHRHVVALALSLAVGCALLSGCVVLCVPGRLFVPVVGVLIGGLMTSASRALTTFEASQLHTAAHIRFLQANGATHLEALMPSVRRTLRAAVLPELDRWNQPIAVAMPALMGGLLMGGASVWAAVVTTLLMSAAALSAAVVTAIVLMISVEKLKK